MKRFLFIILLCIHADMIMNAQTPLKYDTIIDRGIFVSYYNLEYTTPSFVRYKLWHGGGKVKRTGLDFKQTVQGTIYRYAKSGYDKGHLAPAADFAHTRKEISTTFDYVNCLPQTPALNRGEWKRDETRVRSWSQHDSLMIECGGLEFDTIKHQVPKYCYKIVILLSKGDTLLNKVYLNK